MSSSGAGGGVWSEECGGIPIVYQIKMRHRTYNEDPGADQWSLRPPFTVAATIRPKYAIGRTDNYWDRWQIILQFSLCS